MVQGITEVTLEIVDMRIDPMFARGGADEQT